MEVLVQTILRSGLVQGVAIGLSIAAPSYAARMMHIDDDPPTGGGGGGDDPVLTELPDGGGGGGGSQTGGVSDYIAMRSEMQQVLFGSGTSFSLGYALDSFPSTRGTYLATNDSQMMTFEVLESKQISNLAAEANLLPQTQGAGMSNFEIAFVRALATGPTGQTYSIMALAFSFNDANGVRTHRVVPYDKMLDYPDMAELYRYVRSTPPSIVGGAPDGARSPGDNPACVGLSTPQEVCICMAQNAYDLCRFTVERTFEDCQRRAALQFIAAISGCILRVLWSGALSPLLALACIGTIVGYAYLLSLCDKDMRTALNNCYQTFRQAMQPCGILILELR